MALSIVCLLLFSHVSNAFIVTTLAPPSTLSASRVAEVFRLFQTSSASNHDEENNNDNFSRRSVLQSTVALAATVVVSSVVPPAQARLEAVNRPELLPTEKDLNVIQIEKFLTSGQAKRMDALLTNLEKDTGFRLRVLCQNYPETPGLAIRDYWSLGKEDQKDDKYVVLVVDQFNGKGNVLNFNVGEGVKLNLPNIFWTRLQGKYGNTFFVKENGIDLAIVNAVESIAGCLRSTDQFCVDVPDQGVSMKSLGF